MEREANYAAVGAFVLLVLLMAALFIYWYSDTHEHRSYTRYEIYFDGSVSGLTRGASVRYLGVEVGRVVAMSIDPRNSGRVEVLVDIDSTTPVSNHTVAELSLQGITGVLYIDLSSNAGNRRLAEAVPGQKFPVIRAARSNFDVLLASLPEMVGLANQSLERLEHILSDRNVDALTHTLDNLDRATVSLPETVRDVHALATDLRSTSAEFRQTAASIRGIAEDTAPRLRKAVEQLDEIASNLASATGGLQELITENRADLRSFTRDGLPQLERLLREGQAATEEIRVLAQDLREDPSRLLYQPSGNGVEIQP
jgi:phospholipid/cholesterol/gamma-HCH transport system substrate-binding protein